MTQTGRTCSSACLACPALSQPHAFAFVRSGDSDAGRADVLLKQIATETRRTKLFDLLGELQRVPTIPDCTVLLPLTTHRSWQVRWGAIEAPAKCGDDCRAEAALLAVLANPVDDYDRINANAHAGSAALRQPSAPWRPRCITPRTT